MDVNGSVDEFGRAIITVEAGAGTLVAINGGTLGMIGTVFTLTWRTGSRDHSTRLSYYKNLEGEFSLTRKSKSTINLVP